MLKLLSTLAIIIVCTSYLTSTQKASKTNNYQSFSWKSKETQNSLIGAGTLLGLGLYSFKEQGFLNRKTVRKERNRYYPKFSNSIDDYSQYVPYAAVFALDFCGIKGKHTLQRKTSAMAIGAGLNLALVQSLKYTVAEPRPDNSANNSFPSGHTTTAFMGAHLFHKEYGHLSPIYSIAGYSVATFTGVFRQLNNKHWISDVLFGAGLGICSVELAYYLNSLIFEKSGINKIEKTMRDINKEKPHYFEAKIGSPVLLNSFAVEEAGIEFKSGYSIATEMGYFFNKHIGISAILEVQSYPTKVDRGLLKPRFKEISFIHNSFGTFRYGFGPCFQYPFGKNLVGLKILFGGFQGTGTEVFFESEISSKELYAKFNPNKDFAVSFDLYYKRILNDRIALGAYVNHIANDYEYQLTVFDRYSNEDKPIFKKLVKQEEDFDSISAGVNFSIMLW